MAKRRRNSVTTRPTRTTARPAAPTRAVETIHDQPDEAIESMLRRGENEPALREYFGDRLYAELSALSGSQEARTDRAAGPDVLIVPGIAGSKLGTPRPIFDDVVWFDPVDAFFKRLGELSLELTPRRHTAVGVFLWFYLKLKLRLRWQGFNAQFYPYDWRLGVDELGARLARDIARFKRPVHMVCHSMGGLVARAAVSRDPQKRIGRIVMLGTPNHGSFLTIPAMRGVSDFVKLLSRFDPSRTGPELAGEVFNTFPSVYQLMPSPAKFSSINLYDAAQWPAGSPGIRQKLLDGVAASRSKWSDPDERFHLIAGYNVETITGATRNADGNEIDLQLSYAGDGVVPIEFARLDGVPTYFVEEEHGSLANHASVADACADLIRDGATRALPTTYALTRSTARSVRSGQYGLAVAEKLRSPAEITVSHARQAFGELGINQPRDTPLVAAAGPTGVWLSDPLGGQTIARRMQHRLEIHLAKGNITGVKAEAYVVGVFKGVKPSGPAAAIDQWLRGAIADFSTRRMFQSGVGEVFVIPARQTALQTEQVVLVGLGTFDSFGGQVQQTAAENVMRTLIRCRVSDFATVVLGSGSGVTLRESVRNLFQGFIDGLVDADRFFDFRRITLCESDPARFAELRDEVWRLCSTPLTEPVEVTLSESEVGDPSPPQEPVVMRRGTPRAIGPSTISDSVRPVYLSVRTRNVDARRVEVRASLLGAARPVTMTDTRQITRQDLDRLLTFDAGTLRPASAAELGKKIVRQLLAEEFVQAVASHLTEPGSTTARPLVMVLDRDSTRVPWEAIEFGGIRPALVGGLSRSYEADGMSVVKYLARPPEGQRLKVLLVSDPRNDLPGAAREGKRVADVLGIGFQLEWLKYPEATKVRVLKTLDEFRPHILHFAGHAFYNPEDPRCSGLLFPNDEVITGPDLARLPSLPAVTIFNGCESGRIRADIRAVARSKEKFRYGSIVLAHEQSGLAESMLRGGVAIVIGTYWPVGDESAETFAGAFYTRVAGGAPVGEALLEARKQISELSGTVKQDWADYLFYGDPTFRFTGR